MFRRNGPVPADGILRFHCRNLGPDNRCQIYATRPEICRDYPSAKMFARGGNLLPGCGYQIVSGPPVAETFDRVLDREMDTDSS